MSRHLRRRAAAAALFAALLGALMPGVSRMLAALGGFDPALYSVCSAAATAPADGHGVPGHLDACPYCAGHGTTPAPPPLASAWTPAPVMRQVALAPVESAPVDLPWPLAAQPRAPPLAS
ncbi:MAG: DUF2946 family protein [Burkholderiales bacterium]|nr:DUF2946 family protein [Burkholderiales bacterium]MDE1927265.1 DUF2946 family protein [Burkholderiales bacterium]MDE2157697.1 DUF2946 family protein [Burkholderiales bacterium]MDE2503550.1 DUF2946 family protein [Burkholderiales bacterium]